LGKLAQVAENMLRSGESQCKVAEYLKISRRSVGAIAKRMRQGSYAAPSGGSVEQTFDTLVRSDLQRVAKLSLQHITPEKAEQANIRDLATVMDKSLGRLEAIESRAGNLHMFGQLAALYDLTPSHSVSRVTLEQKVTVERQHTLQEKQEDL